MKDLIRKILKEHEEEDPLQWAVDLWNETNPIPINQYDSYIINLLNTPTDPDTFKWKFEQLYGEEVIKKLSNSSHINIFDNSHMKYQVEGGEGFIIYVRVDHKTITTGWDLKKNVNININDYKGYKVFTLLEFLRLVIVDN